MLEPCLEAFSEAGTSASQARFVLGGRFAILFVLSSSNLSNSSASYPDRSIFLSFFIVIPVEKESVKHTRWLSKGNASGASARVNTGAMWSLRGVRRGIYISAMFEICAVTDFWRNFLLTDSRPQAWRGETRDFSRGLHSLIMDELECVSVLSSHVAHVEEERLKRTLRGRSLAPHYRGRNSDGRGVKQKKSSPKATAVCRYPSCRA